MLRFHLAGSKKEKKDKDSKDRKEPKGSKRKSKRKALDEDEGQDQETPKGKVQ